MKAIISLESYEMVLKMANQFAYGNTRSLAYDNYVSVGVEGLKKAVDTYEEGSNVKFSTYLYRCVMNALVNEQKRMKLHNLAEDDGACVNLERYDGEVIELRDERMEESVKMLIRKAVKGSERNAQIVELHLGLNCEPMELKDIATMFNLTHESVRLVCVKAKKAMAEDKSTKELLYSFVG